MRVNSNASTTFPSTLPLSHWKRAGVSAVSPSPFMAVSAVSPSPFMEEGRGEG